MSSPPVPDMPPAKELPEGIPARGAMALSLWGIPSVLCFLAATVLLGLGPDSRDGEWANAALGFSFGVVSLAALWTVFGPFRMFTRVPLAILLAVLAVAALAWFLFLQLENSDRPIGVLLITCAGGLQWLGSVMLLILARRLTGSRVAIPGTCQPAGNQASQFGIRQLLMWTTGVAITLGAARLVVGQLGVGIIDWQSFAHNGITLAILLAFNLLLACSIAWAVLSTRYVGVRLAIAVLSIVLATVAEPHAIALVAPGTPSAGIFWWINAAGSLCLAVNLLIARLCGYRLVLETGSSR